MTPTHWSLLDAVLILGIAALVVILWPAARGPR